MSDKEQELLNSIEYLLSVIDTPRYKGVDIDGYVQKAIDSLHKLQDSISNKDNSKSDACISQAINDVYAMMNYVVLNNTL